MIKISDKLIFSEEEGGDDHTKTLRGVFKIGTGVLLCKRELRDNRKWVIDTAKAQIQETIAEALYGDILEYLYKIEYLLLRMDAPEKVAMFDTVRDLIDKVREAKYGQTKER